MSWKPVVQVKNEGDKWHHNGLVFATREEAFDNARDLHRRWTMATAYDAVEVDEPVNYRWVDHKLEAVNMTTYRARLVGQGGDLDQIEANSLTSLALDIADKLRGEWLLSVGDSVLIEKIK